ncbi:MAG: hypothetical protein NWE78_06130, partial [Candidatus Bathyarchaeota archaeon]|nr:hypothetical protein [Candidatus Bathyarchaeota archaeon]
MSEKIIEVTKIVTKEGVKFYLFITRSRMIIADLFPNASQPISQGKAIAFGVLGQAVLHARSAREDTGEKRQLRTMLETYEKSRDKNLLDALSVDQIVEADENIKILGTSRIIPYSSLSKVIMKKPGRFRKAKLITTQDV